MKNKKSPYILMAAFLALGLSACSKEEAPKEEKTSEQVEETKTSEQKEETGGEAKDGTY